MSSSSGGSGATTALAGAGDPERAGEAHSGGLGGRINEKAKAGAVAPMAFTLHGVFARDHFPDALLKRRDDDLARLEAALAAELAAVQEARRRIADRDAALRPFRTATASPASLGRGDALATSFDVHDAEGALDGIVSAPLLAALRSSGTARVLAALDDLLDEEAPGVYSFEVLDPAFCDALRQRTRAFVEFQAGVRRGTMTEGSGVVAGELRARGGADGGSVGTGSPGAAGTGDRSGDGGAALAPNSGAPQAPVSAPAAAPASADGHTVGADPGQFFTTRVAVLDHMGLDVFLDKLLEHVIRPLSALLFKEVGGESLDYRHGFIVGYAPTLHEGDNNVTRTSLVAHTDDAEVTLNVCIGGDFEGGELLLRGLRGAPHEGREQARVKHVLGRGILHLGQHVHEVLPVTRGQRHVMIVWTRSSAFRAETCPCCVMHRRKGDCICDRSWN